MAEYDSGSGSKMVGLMLPRHRGELAGSENVSVIIFSALKRPLLSFFLSRDRAGQLQFSLGSQVLALC